MARRRRGGHKSLVPGYPSTTALEDVSPRQRGIASEDPPPACEGGRRQPPTAAPQPQIPRDGSNPSPQVLSAGPGWLPDRRLLLRLRAGRQHVLPPRLAGRGPG